jgi:CheY-like chemotaxis protein
MNTVAVRRVCISVEAAGAHARPAAVRTVLLAVDDPDFRAVSTRVLEAAGYRVLSARHSGHALLACLTGGRIDVLLTDLRMQEGSGPALAECLRRHNPDLRGVYFSDDPAAAAANVLVRPLMADALLDAVRCPGPH